jgi:hypothetical protein
LPYLQLPKVLHTALVQLITGKGNTLAHRRPAPRLPSPFGVWRLASSVSSLSEAANLYAVSIPHPNRLRPRSHE